MQAHALQCSTMEETHSDWPQELELALTGIAQGGDAVGRYNGRTVFVAGALPGEHVRVRLHDRQRAFARGTATEILHAAPERVPSLCPLETTCSAGGWRWVDYAAQLRFKATILQEQLRHVGGIDVAVQTPDVSHTPPLAYRTTAELHANGKQLGYYLLGTRRVADLPACCLHHRAINQTLATLRSLLDQRTRLRGVTLRCDPATGQTLGVLNGGGDLRPLARRWLRADQSLIGVAAANGTALAGENALEHEVAGLRFRVGARSFFQINYQQWEPLIARVRELLAPQPPSQVLDLYCGVGLFALALARDVHSVLGIESWQPAIADAEHNAKCNGIDNTRFVAGNAEHMLHTLEQRFDRVVLDPPRRGCAPEVLDTLIQHAPARIVYVSCHPGTQSRDCKQLAQAGYKVRSAEIIDIFPHTPHVESIVVLER
jgi:23S rRNA (uracil1939-C5)-methyltransferase